MYKPSMYTIIRTEQQWTAAARAILHHLQQLYYKKESKEKCSRLLLVKSRKNDRVLLLCVLPDAVASLLAFCFFMSYNTHRKMHCTLRKNWRIECQAFLSALLWKKRRIPATEKEPIAYVDIGSACTSHTNNRLQMTQKKKQGYRIDPIICYSNNKYPIYTNPFPIGLHSTHIHNIGYVCI